MVQGRVGGSSFHRGQAERCRPGHSCPSKGPIRLRPDMRRVGRNIGEGEGSGGDLEASLSWGACRWQKGALEVRGEEEEGR